MAKVQEQASQTRQRLGPHAETVRGGSEPLMHHESRTAEGFGIQDEANRLYQELMSALASPPGKVGRLLPGGLRNLRMVNRFESHVAVTGRLVGSVNVLLRALAELESALHAWDSREAAWRSSLLQILEMSNWHPAHRIPEKISGDDHETHRWSGGSVDAIMGRLRELAQSIALLQSEVPSLRTAQQETVSEAMEHVMALSVRFAHLENDASALRQENDEMRQRLSALEEKVSGLALSPAPSGLQTSPATAAASPSSPAPVPAQAPSPEQESGPVPIGGPEFDFLAWEELTRGEEGTISEEQKKYLPWFAGAPGPVLDAGCGRGEFLSLLVGAGIDCYGIDLDPSMVAHCQSKGLRVETAELFEHLRSLPDESLGGLFLAQVVEHIPPPALRTLTDLAFSRLRPGGSILMETINPTCLTTFSGAFYADPTHHKPVHPKALEYFLSASGFGPTEIIFSAPIPPEHKLKDVREEAPLDPAVKSVVLQINDNFDRLNSVLYGYANFAAAARKPARQ